MGSESEAAVKSNDSNLPLKSLGKYAIVRRLGQGGMGTVYLATNVDLRKTVALKVLPRDKASNPILVRRFKAEAQAAGQLEHPNIVAVYDAGEADGYLYIAMEFVDGVDLFEHLKRRKRIPVKRSIEIIKEVAAALQHAYEHNIVHRDIKPSNLLLRRDGVVKITDLGLARSVDETLETNITRAGTTVGTVDYMSPEQARNSKSADIRSDIYSLGCTWYQMLTGLPPFPDGSLTNKLHAHSVKPLPNPREHNENVPEGIFAVLQRMTAKKPEDRYQTPAELLDDLNRAKLTNAAFSNEIFSDLSDDEIPIDEDSSDDDIDEEDDNSDDEEIAANDVVQRRKARSENIDDDSDEPPSDSKQSKNRQRSIETNLEQTTHPLKPQQKSSSKTKDSDPNQSSSQRKRNSPAGDESSSSSGKTGANAKTEKSSAAGAGGEKNSTKMPHKPLPPKRQPIVENENPPSAINFEVLKLAVFVLGITSIVLGLGWVVFRWSLEVDDVSVHQVRQPAAEVTVVAPQVVTKAAETPETTNPNIAERPVAEFDIAKQPLPAWAATDATPPSDLPILSVGPGPTTATHFPNIDEAIRAVGKSGAVVRLLGNGPFLMSNLEVGNTKKLVIAAATAEDQPLIILKTAESSGPIGLNMNNGELDLRGLHFVLDRTANSTGSSNAIISVTDGQLYVRDCSFTATGDELASATAVNFTSHLDERNSPALEPRLLLSRVTIRGNGLTGLKIHRTTAEVVIQDSLLVTGTAPSIDIAGHLTPALAEAFSPKPRRTVRVIRTTLCARNEILELAADNAVKPPMTEILFKDSVCSAEGTGNSTVLASATRWPNVTSNSASARWLTNLNWTSISSLYLGFDELLDLDKTFKITGWETWQRVWGGKKFDPNQFQAILWQESLIPQLSSVLPTTFDNTKLPYLEVKTADGHMPGSAVDRLKVPGVISQTRLFAMSQRPKFPAAVAQPADNPNVKKVDLAKNEDLGLILNRGDWQSGTLFEVSGSGLRTMTPAKIVDKSLRIVFLDGQHLKIQPKISDVKTKPDNLGLFNIENGLLDIQSAALDATQTARAAASPWLISAKNASVILRGCQLNGPMLQDLEQHRGLILWTTTGSNPSSSGTEPPFLSLNDCLLMSPGIGVSAECTQGNVFLRNCILAIRGYGINVVPIRSENPTSPIIDVEHVTFSTSKAAFRVEAMAGAEPVASPLRLFVDYCAIVSPLEFKEGEAAESSLIQCDGSALEQKQIEWWGYSNGVANEVQTLLRRPNADPISSPVGWNSIWGDSSSVRLLAGAKGVQLVNNLPNKWANLKVTSFNLDPASPSATWAEGGRPLGADPHIEEMLLAKKSPKEIKPGAAKPGPTKPASTNKSPGF